MEQLKWREAKAAASIEEVELQAEPNATEQEEMPARRKRGREDKFLQQAIEEQEAAAAAMPQQQHRYGNREHGLVGRQVSLMLLNPM